MGVHDPYSTVFVGQAAPPHLGGVVFNVRLRLPRQLQEDDQGFQE